MEPVMVGVLGCGTISDAYFSSNNRFKAFEITTCADIDLGRAETKAREYDLTATDPAGLFENSDVEIVLNLTPPAAHGETCRQAIEADKHLYTEKPLATSTDEAATIVEAAAEAGKLVGSAPDTFLGAGLQTCRRVIDEGRIGKPIGATAVWASPGHERWHPNPDFYYREGGGPLFDMGPYYVTALVSLFGPARRVTGSVSRAFDERPITSEPRSGETIDVEVPTHEAGIVDFKNGAIANILTTFDAIGGTSLPDPAFEIYGTNGTLVLPDPNLFEGPVHIREQANDGFKDIPLTHEYTDGRGAGVADLAYAIRSDWNHRTSGALAHHVLEILEGVRTASGQGEHLTIESEVTQPEQLPPRFPDKMKSNIQGTC